MKIKLQGSGEKLTGFRYFWMKTVTGFTPSSHCARCLKGEYSKEVGKDMQVGQEIELDYPEGTILYLCGVSVPYVWKDNFHLAMRVKKGDEITAELHTGQSLSIKDAEPIRFDSTVSDEHYGHKSRAFTTCRNFQFGAFYEANLKP